MTVLHLTKEHYDVLDWVARQTQAMRPQPPKAPPPDNNAAYRDGFRAGREKAEAKQGDKSRLDATYFQGVLAGKENAAEDVAFWRENSRECSKRNNALTDKVRDLEKEAESMHLALLASDKTIVKLNGIKDSFHRDLNRALRAKAALKDILKRVEWEGNALMIGGACPCCGRKKADGHYAGCILAQALKSEGDGFDKDALLKKVRETVVKVVSGEWPKTSDARPWITSSQWDMLAKVLGEEQVKNNFRRV